MPFYDYECENEECKHCFEAKHGFHDKLTTCPECEQESLTRPFNVPVVSVPKTLGSLADKNSANMSTDEKTAFTELQKKRKDTLSKKLGKGHKKLDSTPGDKPWYTQYQTKTDKQISTMTPEQKKKYVSKGS